MINNKNNIIYILAGLSLVLIALLVYFQVDFKSLPPQEAADKGVEYINKNVLQGAAEATLIGEIEEEKGLYKFDLDINGQKITCHMVKDGSILFPQGIRINEIQKEESNESIGGFKDSGEEVCREDGKPIVYFFGSESCPHCSWEHPVIKEVAGEFGDKISFHDNMDSDADMDVFQKYSTGGVPTLVIGCKYYRVGSGERSGEEGEKENLTNLICELTKGQPTEICQN